MRNLILIASILLLSGCASPVWYRPNTTQAQFDKDKAYCEYEAMKYAGGYDPTMQTAVGQGFALGMRRGELGIACMRQLGYQQQTSRTAALSTPVKIPDGIGQPGKSSQASVDNADALSKEAKAIRKKEALSTYLNCIEQKRPEQSQHQAETSCSAALKQYRESAYQLAQVDGTYDIFAAAQAAEDEAIALGRGQKPPSAPAKSHATDIPLAPASTSTSTADELQKLADLKQQGVLTPAEFDAAKARLLAR